MLTKRKLLPMMYLFLDGNGKELAYMCKRPAYDGLKGWLVANRITQPDVAKVLGTTPNYINKKLNGTGADFKLSEARALHSVFGTPMAYFFEIEVPYKERKEKSK